MVLAIGVVTTHNAIGLSRKTFARSAVFTSLFCILLIAAAASASVSFRNDVMAVISKAGCNAGTCHGNQNGKAMEDERSEVEFKSCHVSRLARAGIVPPWRTREKGDPPDSAVGY